MPENAAARLSPRQSLPPVSTGYEVARVVKDAQTNYTPAEAGPPSKANDLMQSLGVLGKMIPVAVDVGKAIVEDRTKKGAQARFVGDALDPNQSNAFIDGYERMDGQYRGVAFGNAAKEFAATNSHLPPDEFQKGLDALQNEYVGKLVHQGQLDTFLPSALKGGEHATSIYQESKNAAIMGERNQKVQNIQEGKMKIVLDQAAFDVAGIPFSKGFASVGTDPVMRQKLMDNLDAFRAVVSPQFRQIHDDSRADFKTLGLTPAQVATKFVGTVGRLAGDVGIIGIMDYAYQKDLSGMSPETANPELVNKYSDQARAMDTQISTAMLAKQEKADKQALDKRNSDRMMILANPATTPEEAKKVFLDVQGETKMDPDLAWKIGTHAADVMLGQGFNLKDNQTVYRQLEMGIGSGKLTGEAAYKALLDSAHELSPSSYQHLIEKVFSIENRKGDSAKDHAWANYTREVGAHQSSITKTLGVTDDFGKIMVNLDYTSGVKLRQITSDGLSMYFRGLESLKNKFGGAEENIPGEEITKLHDRVVNFYRPSVDEVVRMADANAGYGGDPNAPKGPPAPKKPGLIDRAKAALAPAPAAAPEPAPTVIPPGIPEGYSPTGQTVGGKPAWVSPDGKMIEVEK